MTRELMRKRAEPMRVATKRKSVMPNCHGVSFGVPNVPGVQSRIDAEAEARRQEIAEKQEEYEERRDNYYGNEKKGTMRKRPKFFLFDLDDLDNEEIISLVEVTPTFKRSKETLADIKARASGAIPMELEATAEGPNSTVISF